MKNKQTLQPKSIYKIQRSGAMIAAATLSVLLAACNHGGSQGDFTVDKATGVQYKFIEHNENGTKPVAGDYAQVEMLFKTSKDSVIMNTHTMRKRPGDTSHGISIPLKFNFTGCLEQGITLMSAGDSAIFKINADSLFVKQFQMKKLPPYIQPGSYLIFQVKLLYFQTAQQLQQMRQQMMAKKQAEAEMMKAQEQPAIQKYMTDHHYDVKPNADSIYILKKTVGKGKEISDGDTVTVAYTGRLLSGQGFDSSTAAHGPYKFAYSANAPAIKGWIFALKGAHQGEKETVLIPSALGYGQYGMGGAIPPYTPLLFDMEVLKVEKGAPADKGKTKKK